MVEGGQERKIIWCLAVAIVAAALFLRFTRPPIDCLPVARLQQLEKDVFASLDRSLANLRRERDQLAAENAALKSAQQQRRRVATDASTPANGQVSRLSSGAVPAPAPTQGRSCGAGSALVQALVLWRNHHGRMVRRTVSIGERRLSICKRSQSPEYELSLYSGMTAAPLPASGSDSYLLCVRRSAGDAAGEATQVVIQLSSAAERAAWLRALVQSGVGPPPSALSTAPLQRAGAVESDGTEGASVEREATRACHQRALAFGAEPIAHRVRQLTRERRRHVCARAEAAASSAAGQSQLERGPTGAAPGPLLELPSPTASGFRFLSFERGFAHGLGHEFLVYNLGARRTPPRTPSASPPTATSPRKVTMTRRSRTLAAHPPPSTSLQS